MKRLFRKLCLFSTLLGLPLWANGQSLIPQPVSVKGHGRLVKITKIDAKVDKSLRLPAEGYKLRVKNGKAIIRGKDAQGLIWGQTTLRQLQDECGQAHETTIIDYPAFPIRGFMHDTGRNFRPVEMLKQELDLFSFYKLNVFHWHLTDNPAWRIECKAYPQLNDARFQRKGRDEGKYYTYDEIRDVIAYAKARGIMVIPEIDMPGHSQYFNKTFGFGMATPQGMEVLRACLKEFFREIPRSMCPYIHIGSDEIHINNPTEFISFCETLAQEAGREVIAWDPGLKGSSKIIGQVWADMEANHVTPETYPTRYIDSYMGYLNKSNPILNVNRYLLHTPCGVAKATDKALGGILCLWNDVRVDDKALLLAHNGMPEDLLPFAERYWRGGKAPASASKDLIPEPSTEAWKALRSFETKMIYHRDRFLKKWNMRWVANLSTHWKVTLPQRRGTSVDAMTWVDAWGGVVDIMALAKKHGVAMRPTMDAWMKTEIQSDRDTVIQAWVGFETAPRSSRISDGIGYQNEWEAQGRLFVNGVEVLPSQPWKEPGRYRYHYQTWHQAPSELPYTNEQFFWMRQPALIPLKAGRNEVKLYCPRVFPHESWLVGFLPLTEDASGHVTEAKGIKMVSD